MTTRAGLRELRQNASELVKQAESGETITVTVNGREVAELGPVRRDQWRTWGDVAAIFDGPVDDDWARDSGAVDHGLRDPFTTQP